MAHCTTMRFLLCLLLCISVLYLAECSTIDRQDRAKRQIANMPNPFSTGGRRLPPGRYGGYGSVRPVNPFQRALGINPL
ncbi:unnamed protein product [Cylicocyclus nassatus]|uniref:Uncharacterized protein n=1 Tax=Cylicocyclus nassatus TaxID=53992 RepID=A0AA36H7C5_CYLNA|nr:unnamed protein product [Cylicocyclus nassatus]